MIKHVSGDLFQCVSAAKKPVLAHSCNCLGVWGGGIALQFRKRYPSAYDRYKSYCLSQEGEILGSALVIEESDCRIACLFTSIDGGGDIVGNTALAMESLKGQIGTGEVVHMPKINSGIFGVPWPETEEVLKDSGLNIQVHTP